MWHHCYVRQRSLTKAVELSKCLAELECYELRRSMYAMNENVHS